MSEIEKMYENAGIKPIHYDACKLADAYWVNEELANEYGTFDNYMKLNCPYKYQECTDNCRHAFDRDIYPPFTAEKQLKIFKMILLSTWWINLKRLQFSQDFENGLAELVNSLWQDLSPEEKQQVKGILE